MLRPLEDSSAIKRNGCWKESNKTYKMMKGSEYLSTEDKQKKLELSNLQKRRLRGDLINLYKHLKRRCREDETRILSMVPRARTRGNRHKWKDRKFYLNIGKHHEAD